MPLHLTTTDPDFESAFAAFLAAKREVSEDVDAAVRAIIAAGARARRRGAHRADAALRPARPRAGSACASTTAEIAAAAGGDATARRWPRSSWRARASRATTAASCPRDDRYTDALGAELGSRWTAVESVGLYVPGGLASYPSSVLMNAVPARVAGVPRVAMAVPSPGGELNPLVLAAAHLAGVSEIYRIGGAQAVAALAYGTESVAPVAKIVGPGNAYVAAAKRQVFGTVGIDSIAGPSEVLVIADQRQRSGMARRRPAGAGRARHRRAGDPDDRRCRLRAPRSRRPSTRQLAALPRGNIAGASWETFGAVIVLRSLEEAPPLADRIAAEHLEIATREPEALAGRIRNAGAIFLGAHTPEVIGDYVAGSNHVLPTARSARFSSGLGVLDFMKRTSILKLDAARARKRWRRPP